MRFILSLLTLCSLGFGGWMAWERMAPLQNFVHSALAHNSSLRTLEIRYTAEEIMTRQQQTLLKGTDYKFLEPQLIFYPYLLLEVKFAKDHKYTQEGILLWGLTDGEMVLDTATWEKTHGFEDCLLAKADKNDFKILHTLVNQGGFMDREALYRKFKVDSDVLDEWIDSCRRKKLI